MLYKAAVLAVSASLAGLTSATSCVQSNGNWYCSQVDAITYSNFGKAGSYNRVSYMNDSTGACEFTSTSYSGSIAPFDEELSIHLRGPLYLKQFAFYTPTSSSSKAKRDTHLHSHQRHAHKHDHADSNKLGERATSVACPGSNSTTYISNGKTFYIECGFDRAGNIGMAYTSSFSACIDKCAATSSCVDVSYVSGGGACYMKSSVMAPSYNGNVYGARLVTSSTSSAAVAKTSSTTASSVNKSATTLTTSAKASSTSSVSKAASSSASSAQPSATGSSWTRNSYYSSTAGTAQGVTFLNTMGGGSVSGVWSTYFGSSLSYASRDGSKAASSPQVLADMSLPSSVELALFTSTSCSDGGCGYYRPGIPAYHGFKGSSKIFLFEFSMPNDASGSNQPAIWMLNALIPRTQQYGSCTCWGNTNGCGELDVFETLSSGETRMTSCIHGNQAGGDSDYFLRPTSGTVKAAVVLNNQQAHIKYLDSSFNFGSALSAADYASLIAAPSDVSTVTLS